MIGATWASGEDCSLSGPTPSRSEVSSRASHSYKIKSHVNHEQQHETRRILPPYQGSRCQHYKSNQPWTKSLARQIGQVVCRGYGDLRRRRRQRLHNHRSSQVQLPSLICQSRAVIDIYDAHQVLYMVLDYLAAAEHTLQRRSCPQNPTRNYRISGLPFTISAAPNPGYPWWCTYQYVWCDIRSEGNQAPVR